MTPTTWEVAFFDGTRWVRGPVYFDTRDEAEAAAARIAFTMTVVRSTAELDSIGLPPGPCPKPEDFRPQTRR